MRGPDFARPPVEEVALSVQFAPIRGLTTAHVARYWETIRDRFPRWSEAAPIDPVVELFGAPQVGVPRFSFTMDGGVVPHRALFEDARGTELVQVQQDRFARNWRRRDDSTDYPRYPALRGRFEADLTSFVGFLASNDLGEPSVNQCEVTYVNNLPAGLGWDRHGEVHRVFGVLSSRPSDPAVPEPESVEAVFRYVFTWPDKKEPAGRLHVGIRPVHRISDGTPMLSATLTARGRPGASSAEAAMAWLDVGHDVLVSTFASITTPTMHEIWGRRDVR